MPRGERQPNDEPLSRGRFEFETAPIAVQRLHSLSDQLESHATVGAHGRRIGTRTVIAHLETEFPVCQARANPDRATTSSRGNRVPDGILDEWLEAKRGRHALQGRILDSRMYPEPIANPQ